MGYLRSGDAWRGCLWICEFFQRIVIFCCLVLSDTQLKFESFLQTVDVRLQLAYAIPRGSYIITV